MPGIINLQPENLDLKLYAGDGVTLPMTCVSNTGAPIDLTGDISAQIRSDRLNTDDPVATFSVNTADASIGKVVLMLTGEQTAALVEGTDGTFSGVWDMQWHPAELEPRTLCQGRVECVIDVSR